MRATVEETEEFLNELIKYWRKERNAAINDRKDERFQYCDGHYWAYMGIRAYIQNKSMDVLEISQD